MVDYSSIKVDCLSIVFLFARLGCLLEAIEVVISSLFPLVSHSARVARSLKMFKEVRSSELETGACPRLMTV